MADFPLLLFPISAIPAGFGADLGAARVAKGWSQAELADAAGVTRETVSRLERGVRHPSSDTVFRLEAALDLEVFERLVPAWPEWNPIGVRTHGVRSRERRRSLKLGLDVVGRAAGVSPATLSRFEREVGKTPSLAKYELEGGLPVVARLTRRRYARALGFAGIAEHQKYCVDPD